MGPDRVVEEIDGLLEAYEKTAVLESEPEPSGADRERTGARRALLDLFFLLLAAGAVGGYLFFSGRLDDLTRLLVGQESTMHFLRIKLHRETLCDKIYSSHA